MYLYSHSHLNQQEPNHCIKEKFLVTVPTVTQTFIKIEVNSAQIPISKKQRPICYKFCKASQTIVSEHWFDDNGEKHKLEE